MEHAYLRALLEDARSTLGVLFEHGFAQSQGTPEDLKKLADRFSGAGLGTGGQMMVRLSRELEQSRFQVRYSWGAAALDFAGLWQYLSACIDRLDFFEAQASLQP